VGSKEPDDTGEEKKETAQPERGREETFIIWKSWPDGWDDHRSTFPQNFLGLERIFEKKGKKRKGSTEREQEGGA